MYELQRAMTVQQSVTFGFFSTASVITPLNYHIAPVNNVQTDSVLSIHLTVYFNDGHTLH